MAVNVSAPSVTAPKLQPTADRAKYDNSSYNLS